MGQAKPFETSTETKSKNPTEANPKKTPDGPNSLTATVPLEKSQNPASAEAVCPNGAVNEVMESKNEDSDKASVSSSMKTTDEAFSDIQKKIRRAERFGISVQLSENDKRSSRAERFGTAPPSSGSDEEKKRKARAERFGLPATPTAADEEAKKKARLSRFAEVSKTDSVEDEKRKARAARFLTLTSSTSPKGDNK